MNESTHEITPGEHSAATARLSLGEVTASMPGSYIAWWDEKTDEQKRAVVQDLLDKHGGQFSPDPLIREWLLRQAEVDTDGR